MNLDFQSVCAGVALTAIPLTWLALRKETKALHHEVMISCISRFQDIVDDLAAIDSQPVESTLEPTPKGIVRQYLDLCNEELFYFQNQYLPVEVEIEWLDGMLSFIPVREPALNGEIGQVYFPGPSQRNGYFASTKFWSMLSEYPRLKSVFELSSDKWQQVLRGPKHAHRACVIAQLRHQIKSYHHSASYRHALTKRETITSKLQRLIA